MPTADRHEMIDAAIKCFLAQTYNPAELIILDDGKSPCLGAKVSHDLELPVEDKIIRYIYSGPKRKCIPAKLNRLCEMAKGEVIARMDDDDFSSPERLVSQFESIQQGAQITGFHTVLFYDDRYGQEKVYKFFSSRNFAVGATLMFTKKLWEDNKFNELFITGSDSDFLSRTQKYLKAIDGEKLFVARTHNGSSNQRNHFFSSYKQVALNDLPDEFLHCLEKIRVA